MRAPRNKQTSKLFAAMMPRSMRMVAVVMALLVMAMVVTVQGARGAGAGDGITEKSPHPFAQTQELVSPKRKLLLVCASCSAAQVAGMYMKCTPSNVAQT
jgi:hypothetical protein